MPKHWLTGILRLSEENTDNQMDLFWKKSKKKKKNNAIRTGVSGAWAGSPCSRPAFLQLV
jgi:hypothetical protein